MISICLKMLGQKLLFWRKLFWHNNMPSLYVTKILQRRFILGST